MSEVFWVDAENMSVDNTVAHKLRKLIQESGATVVLSEGMRAALKVNAAEEGYEYGLRPDFIKVMADVIRKYTQKGPVVCDGQRLVDYWRRSKGNVFLSAAGARGYSRETLGGHLAINGGFSGDEGDLFPCGENSALGGVEVGTAICRSDALWVLSHVTLHPLFGLSGALLNGGFECLSGRARTRVLQDMTPYLFNGHRPAKEEIDTFHQRALESHIGVKAAMGEQIFYINYLWDVTPQPEYYPFSEKPVVENLGFLASRDPVALDAETFELIKAHGKDVREINGIAFDAILKEAERLGLGKIERTLKRMS